MFDRGTRRDTDRTNGPQRDVSLRPAAPVARGRLGAGDFPTWAGEVAAGAAARGLRVDPPRAFHRAHGTARGSPEEIRPLPQAASAHVTWHPAWMDVP